MKKSILILFSALALNAGAQTTKVAVETLCGTPGTSGYNNSSVSLAGAQFAGPFGMATDGNGNIWIAEYEGHRVKMITNTLGTVYTRSGQLLDPSMSAGYQNGTASSSKYNGCTGIAVGPDNSLYICDANNSVIRKLSPFVGAGSGQTVTLFAGTVGTAGHADGAGSTAKFDNPQDIAVDKNGNVYVTDLGNHVIRKITQAGVVSTLCGKVTNSGYADGTGTAAQFDMPRGLCLTKAGDLLVCDFNNARIRKVNITTGAVTTLAGDGNVDVKDGAALSAQFRGPLDVVEDSVGGIYIADGFQANMIRYLIGGQVTSIAGESQSSDFHKDGDGKTARFNNPTCLTMDYNKTTLYVSDKDNHVIRRVLVTKTGGGPNSIDKTSQLPVSVFPNPAADGFVGINLPANAFHLATLRDSKGALVQSQNIQGLQQIGFSLQNLSSGVYFLQLEGNQARQTEKILIP